MLDNMTDMTGLLGFFFCFGHDHDNDWLTIDKELLIELDPVVTFYGSQSQIARCIDSILYLASRL